MALAVWLRLRRYFEDIDPDCLHLRIGIVVTGAIVCALLLLYLTPLWPEQLVWAGLMPVMIGVTFLRCPPNEWLGSGLRAFAAYGSAVALGSCADPTSWWYVAITGVVGLVCGLGLAFGPLYATLGITSFVLFAAGSNLPGGIEAIPVRLLAMTMGGSSALILGLTIRWPRADPLKVSGRRLYARLARLLERKQHHRALELQPVTFALWQALARTDSARADELIRHQIVLRNAVVLLVEIEERAAKAGVTEERLKLCAASRRAASALLYRLAAEQEATTEWHELDHTVDQAVAMLRAGADEPMPLRRRLRRSEAVYALEAIRGVLRAELEAKPA